MAQYVGNHNHKIACDMLKGTQVRNGPPNLMATSQCTYYSEVQFWHHSISNYPLLVSLSIPLSWSYLYLSGMPPPPINVNYWLLQLPPHASSMLVLPGVVEFFLQRSAVISSTLSDRGSHLCVDIPAFQPEPNSKIKFPVTVMAVSTPLPSSYFEALTSGWLDLEMEPLRK